MKRVSLIVLTLLLAVSVVACGGDASTESTTPRSTASGSVPVTLMLDWVPNTNHTGVYVAQQKGYFKEAGLNVKIVEPGEVYPEGAVASGAADFGISFQESVTLARAEGAPIVSVAAVLQHNTSGFASLAGLGVAGPADFEGLHYGAWGSPSEIPTLKALMEGVGADFNRLKMVTTGFADALALLSQKQVDLVWIYYGWQGIQAKQQGIDLDIVMMQDYLDSVPDFYTPVVIAGESTIAQRPDTVKRLIGALSRGYTFAAQNPDEAADILMAAAPELDKELVKESQRWISPYYIAEAPRWGEQKESVWQGYSDWLAKNGVVASSDDVKKAFTNQFLP
ncbi:MAG: ABC transporter substrate-binding protein [Thermoleophilia bacterium]|jgi:ABC-type nitrate/sulfonate/bicarbonate transport system substrate-binding protein